MIITKTLPATNHRGTRVQARAHNRIRTFGWLYEEDEITNHAFAAARLARDLGWSGVVRVGIVPGSECIAYVDPRNIRGDVLKAARAEMGW